MLNRLFFAALLCLAAVTSAWHTAAAQERVASNGPWVAQCRVDRVAGKACEVQTLHDIKKTPLANYWLTYSLKDKLFSLVGAPCPSGGRIWIDKQPAAALDGCTRCTCPLRPADSQRLFDAARTGKSLFIEVRDAKGAALGPYETRLRDFDKTYRAAAANNTAR